MFSTRYRRMGSWYGVDAGSSLQRILRQKVYTMKMRYFADTAALHIEFRTGPVSENRDLDENTALDVDPQGNICAITAEHAPARAGIPDFSCEQFAA